MQDAKITQKTLKLRKIYAKDAKITQISGKIRKKVSISTQEKSI